MDEAAAVQVMSALAEVRETVLAGIETQGAKAELMAALSRLADLQATLTEGLMARTIEEMAAPARHQHRRPRQRPEWLRPVSGIVPAGGLGTALHRVLAAHPAATAATGAATVALAATVSAVPAAHPAVRHVPAATAQVPAGIDVSAVPALFPPPAAVPSADARSAHKAYKARHARPLAPASSPPQATPSPPPSPSPSPPPSPSPSPAPGGTLIIQQQQLFLGAGRSAQIVLLAEGGPVIWTASSPDPAVTLSAAHGGIPAGGSGVLTVTVDPAAMARPGSAAVTVNGQQITVTWGRP